MLLSIVRGGIVFLALALFVSRARLFGHNHRLHAVDRRTQCVKLFLIARHNADRTVGMQIAREIVKLQIAAFHLGQAPLEELGVVGLEMNLAAELQHLFIFFEERVVRQPPLCVLFAGPRIAEVDIEQVDLVVGEKRVDVRGVE